METTYCEIFMNLENDLSQMKEVQKNVTDQMEYDIRQCKVVLYRMFNWTFRGIALGLNIHSVVKSTFNRILHQTDPIRFGLP